MIISGYKCGPSVARCGGYNFLLSILTRIEKLSKQMYSRLINIKRCVVHEVCKLKVICKQGKMAF